MKSIFLYQTLTPLHVPSIDRIEGQSPKFLYLRDGRVDSALVDGGQESVLLFEVPFILMNCSELVVTTSIGTCFSKEFFYFFPERGDACL